MADRRCFGASKSSTIEGLEFLKPPRRIVVASGGSKYPEIRSPLVSGVKHGSPSLARDSKCRLDYKTRARKEDKHPTLNTAPARSVIKKRAWTQALGPGPGPGLAQRACHTFMGL